MIFFFNKSVKFLLLTIFLFSSSGKSTLPHPFGNNSEETSLWTRTLGYEYKNYQSDNNDRWHEHCVAILNNENTQAFIRPRGPNIAFARIGVIYQRDENCSCELYNYNLPFVFLSGGTNRLNQLEQRRVFALQEVLNEYGQIIGINHTQNPIQYVFVNNALGSLINANIINSDPNGFAYTHRFNLQQIYSQNILSDFNHINNKEDEILNLPINNQGDGFIERFYHSEQALFLQLQFIFSKNNIHLQNLTNNIPVRSIIHKFVLDIASFYDICLDCSDTAFRQSEVCEGFVKVLSDSFFNHPNQYNFFNDIIPFSFVKVSSLNEKTYNPPLNNFNSTRGQQSNWGNQAILEENRFFVGKNLRVEGFNFYVSQNFNDDDNN